MKPAKQKKNTKYYLKKAAVSAVGAVAAASLLVNGLFPSAREITAGLPETPPAIVQVCEPELPEEQEEKTPEKKTRKQRFKEKLLSLPLWARSVLLLPLWGFGGAAVWLLKRILPGARVTGLGRAEDITEEMLREGGTWYAVGNIANEGRRVMERVRKEGREYVR